MPVHSLGLRVYYEDTDAAGIVYYANYLKFAERGRTEMMRGLGFAHSAIFAQTGTAFAVRRLTADYRLPARLDDWLTVETRIAAAGGATLDLDQQVKRGEQVLAAFDIQVACIGADGRPRRLPAGLRAALRSAAETSLSP
ncbi:MAG: tol-pal system-associated acyl-CoA thioesterase [Alphaproteobacteria bacterium]|nr:tol-pal system-associated acyl-CoA thioesterase [Alphaproteobacteria bacterium]